MAEFIIICEKCGKTFVVGMLSSYEIKMRYMGIEDYGKIYGLLEREREFAYKTYEGKHRLQKTLYFAVRPQKCPYCDADGKYLREDMHFP